MLKFVFLIFCLLILTAAKSAKRYGGLNAVASEPEPWEGNWFPNPPGEHQKPHEQHKCDDGTNFVGVDFDPADRRQSFNYLCIAANRTAFTPDLNREALLAEHYIAPAYRPAEKCLNESIVYEDELPTFGAFRPLAPKYGTYKYLPPQRWLHSLAEGAIVLLYHPCAFPGQITQLQNILNGCLYRHIITPSQRLSPERPLALLAWGKSLQMSVVDKSIAVQFIKDNAKHGAALSKSALNLSKASKFYDIALLSEAHLVTDEDDSEICGYSNEM